MRLLLYQLLGAKTTKKNYSLTTDSKEVSYESSHKATVGVKFRDFFFWVLIPLGSKE